MSPILAQLNIMNGMKQRNRKRKEIEKGKKWKKERNGRRKQKKKRNRRRKDMLEVEKWKKKRKVKGR